MCIRIRRLGHGLVDQLLGWLMARFLSVRFRCWLKYFANSGTAMLTTT